jgi:cyanuric acid amidohydrolase
MARQCIVYRVPMRHPGDASAVLQLIDGDMIAANSIVAIFAKTEGNGCVNDFTRGYSVAALSAGLASRLGLAAEAVPARIAMVMSGGTEGGLSPHFLVFAVASGREPTPGRKALAIATASTAALRPEELGRVAQVTATAKAVRAAMDAADITEPSDVHWVQVKCPLLTNERVAEVRARGRDAVTTDAYASMGLSRGASALGVAVALGEIDAAVVDEDAIVGNFDLWSSRASCSAGIELMNAEIVVLGNSKAWAGDRVISHGVMRDAIDLPAVNRVLRDLGFAAAGEIIDTSAARFDAVLTKAEASRSGLIRGARHIMNDDSDIHSTRHARALVGGVVAAAVGFTELFVSGGAEHQGPDGGGPIAIIARRG